MHQAIVDAVLAVVRALLPSVIDAVRAGGEDATIKRRVMIRARRLVIAAAYDELAKR